MRQPSAKNTFPAGNPIANALVVIAGVLVIATSIVLGFVAFIALSAIVLVTAAIVGVRVWWYRRKMGGAPRNTSERTQNNVIEGEYRVLNKDPDEA